jgi:hypothetical protein
VVNQRSKHIDIRYHYIRDVISKGLIDVQYVSSGFNTADIMTKALGKQKFYFHRKNLGMRGAGDIDHETVEAELKEIPELVKMLEKMEINEGACPSGVYEDTGAGNSGEP